MIIRLLSNLGVVLLVLLGIFGCDSTTTTGSLTDGDDAVDGDIQDPDGDEDVPAPSVSYPIVDTGQNECYGSDTGMECAAEGAALSGQDAQYVGYQARYRNNGDGTISDLVTGLMWQKSPGEKMTADQALAGADSFKLAGYNDWRLPNIKELYSLILFTGVDPSGYEGTDVSGLIPFIETDYFDFAYGDTDAGERIIDSQWATTSFYVDDTMEGEIMFGVNFADGRIKGYGTDPLPGQATGKLFFAIYVRGGDGYGENDFADNGNETISDNATGLMWQQADSGTGMIWEDALAFCEDLSLAGYDDWRLPNAKELQSIVDYTRSPGTTNSAAVDPLFSCTPITNEAGAEGFPFYWTSTTHANWSSGHDGGNAAYVAFGRAMGFMNNNWMDVHGAGAQRSDPKMGNPADYPTGHGPQGDAIRIYNYVRCVRAGGATVDYDPPTDGDIPTDGDDELVDGDDLPVDGDEPAGPVACTQQADCLAQGACPAAAVLGCVCSSTPQGSFCIPSCNTDADCPDPPDMTLICDPSGVCIPEGGPQQ
jgi:hypothetical protein